MRSRLKSSGVVWASADFTREKVVPQTSTTASSSRCAMSERERGFAWVIVEAGLC
jgi:hypothetical protein